MAGADVGYIRVSSVDQNLGRQLDGVHLDKVFEDKVSGGGRNRPGLKLCMDYLREGDTLHVHSIDRLARNLIDLQQIVDVLVGQGVRVEFHKEGMVFDGSSADPLKKLLFQMLGSFAEFERALIRERQREGLEQAKAAGKKLGRPRRADDATIAKIRDEYADGVPAAKLAKRYDVPRGTIHTWTRDVKRRTDDE